jgi:hypothetical protein
MRAFRILLHIPRHDRIAPSAHGNIKRRSRPPRIGHTRRESDSLQKIFRLSGSLKQTFTLAIPAPVAIFFNVLSEFGS